LAFIGYATDRRLLETGRIQAYLAYSDAEISVAFRGGAGRRAGRCPPSDRVACAKPPDGDSWLHEIKHDRHRLVAIVTGRGLLKLLSRNGIDRTRLFRDSFRTLTAAGHPIVIDGEIAVPDERGVTHLDALTDALGSRRSERLAYFAFDLLYFDGHDLRRCPIEHRKALLREILAETAGDRVVYVDHVIGRGADLFEKIRELGAEGIVSKRRGRPYRGGESRDWLKTKCFETGVFAITGFQELGEGRLEAIYVAEDRAGGLRPAGQVRFGFAGKGLWDKLDRLRAGPVRKGNPRRCWDFDASWPSIRMASAIASALSAASRRRVITVEGHAMAARRLRPCWHQRIRPPPWSTASLQ
jgi:ATP-dependent DNA ligase